MNNMKKSLKTNNGITLIALVITIIVLLILAGISISMLSGDNSILQKATTAKQTSERAEAREQAQIDIMAWITDKTSKNEDSSLDDIKVKDILTGKSYVKNGEPGNESFITAKGEYEIPYSELYQLTNVLPVEPENPAVDLGALKTIIENENGDCMIDEKGNIMPTFMTWRIFSLDNENKTAIIGGDYDGDTDDVYSGYLGGISENGELEYQIPVYVKVNGQVYSVIELGDYLLYRRTALKKLYIPEGIESIGDTSIDAWNESNLEILKYPSTLNRHGSSGVFWGRMTHLKKIIIDSETVARASKSEFAAFTSIGSSTENKPDIYVKSTITTIGDFISSYYTQTTSDETGYVKYVAN